MKKEVLRRCAKEPEHARAKSIAHASSAIRSTSESSAAHGVTFEVRGQCTTSTLVPHGRPVFHSDQADDALTLTQTLADALLCCSVFFFMQFVHGQRL